MRLLSSTVALALAFLSLNAPAYAKHEAVAVLAVQARQQPGNFAVHVTGYGPAMTIVHLFVQNWISRDLPALPVGSNGGNQDITTDSTGRFSVDLALSNTYFEGSLVTIDAAVPAQDLHASTNFLVGVPSPGVKTQADHIQSK